MTLKPPKSPLGKFKLHLYAISALTLMFLIAVPFKISSYLDHRNHASEELTRKTRLWERNCKLSHARVDASGELDCDELLCFISKTADRIALARTLSEVDVLGRLFSPATWQYVTQNLGAAGFVLVLVYIALTFSMQYLQIQMQLASQRRRDACENPLLSHSTGYAHSDGATAYGAHKGTKAH